MAAQTVPTNSFRIFEVGLRDGLQSEKTIVSLDDKFELAKSLCLSGIQDIELGSFVRPDAIPQLKDTAQLIEKMRSWRKSQNISSKFWSFVPNKKGFDRAVEAQVDGMGFFVAVSKTFNEKNINRTQEEAFDSLKILLKQAADLNVPTRVYLSTLVYCPYEGVVDYHQVQECVDELFDLGASEVALSDTTGHAHPISLRPLFEELLKKHPVESFSLHFHDTRNLALANCLEAIEHGFRSFDSSVAGMGGCPYAPGASGNLATEDLIYFLKEWTNQLPSLERLATVGFNVENILKKRMPSKVLQTLKKK